MDDLKTVLITGSSRGIGLACALKFAGAGYRVALHYRTDAALAERICSDLLQSKTFQADLTDPESCENLIKNVKDSFGRIDVLVNNAGISRDQVIAFAKQEDFERLLATNLRPVFLLTKFVSKIMIKQKTGSIVNITSVVGFTGNAGQSIYAATKSAITGFSKSVALDLAGFGIRCNTVAPGFIKTEMTDSLGTAVTDAILSRVPMKRLGSGDEVANAVLFLASDQASYITGSTIHVNGGMFTN